MCYTTSMKTHNLAFIDTETTGLNPDVHEVIEFACIIARQIDRPGRGPLLEIVEEFEMKIKPEHIERAEEQALRINGYNEDEWIFAIDQKNAWEHIAKKVAGCNMVSHNITFDHGFVSKSFERYAVENTFHFHKIDTISMAFARLYDVPQAQKFSLRALCELFKIENTKAHTALADTRALYEVYKKMMQA
jgi:DNA polymerase III alpha subunit (gram-positive type)